MRLAIAGAALVLVAAVVIAIASSGGARRTTSPIRHKQSRSIRADHAIVPAPVRLTYSRLSSLTAPVQDPASAPLGGGRFVLLGGLDAADTSTARVIIADARGQVSSASLPNAQHDAQAATLSGNVYVFGGGGSVQYDHIFAFDPAARSVHQVGALPRPASDVAVTETDGTAYIVGGFDGKNWLDTVIAWRPGSAPRVAAHLPVPLRYTAVTATGSKVVIIGGSTPAGVSDAIYRFDPTTGSVQKIGRLPTSVTHAGAATIGASAYLVGGRRESVDALSASVWAIDPVSGSVRAVGRLPQPLSDAGIVSLGDAIVVAGGHTYAGTQATVGELAPAR